MGICHRGSDEEVWSHAVLEKNKRKDTGPHADRGLIVLLWGNAVLDTDY